MSVNFNQLTKTVDFMQVPIHHIHIPSCGHENPTTYSGHDTVTVANLCLKGRNKTLKPETRSKLIGSKGVIKHSEWATE